MGGPAGRAIEASFKPKYPANNGSARILGKSAQAPSNPLHFGGEYAVYMMAQARAEARQTGLSRRFPSPFQDPDRPQNLDAPPLSPYTSAVPQMDMILNPRGT